MLIVKMILAEQQSINPMMQSNGLMGGFHINMSWFYYRLFFYFLSIFNEILIFAKGVDFYFKICYNILNIYLKYIF